MVAVHPCRKHRTTLRRPSAASGLRLLRRPSGLSVVATRREHKPARTCLDAKARKAFFAHAKALTDQFTVKRTCLYCQYEVPRATAIAPVVSDTLSVMSFNLLRAFNEQCGSLWEDRVAGVQSIVRTYSPDILGTQEGLRFALCGILSSADLRHEYAFCGETRSASCLRRELGAETCAIMFRRSRFTLLESGDWWFSDKPTKKGSRWDKMMRPRLCTWVLLEERCSPSRQILALNTHLEHQCGMEYDVLRTRAACMLRQRAAAWKQYVAVVITGDFNAPRSAAVWKELGACFTDALGGGMMAPATCHDGHGVNMADGDIDGVLYDAAWLTSAKPAEVCRQRGCNGLFPSDHYPVVAHLKWVETEAVSPIAGIAARWEAGTDG